MPVVLGDNLTLEDSKLSAVYKELYTKLNKAYAWSYDNITSSEGSALYINLNGELVSAESCSDKKYIYCNGTDNSAAYLCVLNGKLYIKQSNNSLVQVGSDINWVSCSSLGSYGTSFYALNDEGEAYYFNSVNRTTGAYTTKIKISDVIFDQLAGSSSSCYLISNGKLYYSNGSTTATQIGSDTDWEKVIEGREFRFIKGGQVYMNPTTLISPNVNNIIDISAHYSMSGNSTYSPFGLCLGNDGKIYGMVYYNNTNQIIEITSSPGFVTKIFDGSDRNMDAVIVTQDGKLYKTIYSGTLISNQPTWYQIGNGINWTDAICGQNGSKILAIGDGKLYFIGNDNIPTQIGSENTFQKISGAPDALSVAWCGSSISEHHTVYTTKHPQVNDNLYKDTNLTDFTTCRSINGTTVTDDFRTYRRNGSEDSSFTDIPLASVHESLTVNDILIATNPNS